MSQFDLSPLWISLRTSAIATLITFFLGIASAHWMLDRRTRWRGLIDGLLISPLVLPPTVIGFLLLLLLGPASPMGRFLNQLGILVTFTWYAAIITATVVAFPIMYRTSLSVFEQIDPNLIRVARTLGASEWIIFWQIMVPLAFRGIVAATILSFAFIVCAGVGGIWGDPDAGGQYSRINADHARRDLFLLQKRESLSRH